MDPETTPVYRCPYCGNHGTGKYCNNCGKKFLPPQITVKGIFHEVFHLFTKVDSGFLYTLKRLITAPGQMQWDYIHHARYRYQKPFSMLFICGSVAAIIRFTVYKLTAPHPLLLSEAVFYREYWILLHFVLMPVYVLIIYLFFYKYSYNYAETGVLTMYLFSYLFLVSGFASLFKFFFTQADTVFIELPFSAVVVPLTFIRFFKQSPWWASLVKALLILATIFFIVQLCEDGAFSLLQPGIIAH